MAFVCLAVNAALFFARMFATPDSFTRSVTTDIGDFLPTLLHLLVAAAEFNFFCIPALPSDLNRTFFLLW